MVAESSDADGRRTHRVHEASRSATGGDSSENVPIFNDLEEVHMMPSEIMSMLRARRRNLVFGSHDRLQTLNWGRPVEVHSVIASLAPSCRAAGLVPRNMNPARAKRSTAPERQNSIPGKVLRRLVLQAFAATAPRRPSPSTRRVALSPLAWPSQYPPPDMSLYPVTLSSMSSFLMSDVRRRRCADIDAVVDRRGPRGSEPSLPAPSPRECTAHEVCSFGLHAAGI